jgi:hypothetical protein
MFCPLVVCSRFFSLSRVPSFCSVPSFAIASLSVSVSLSGICSLRNWGRQQRRLSALIRQIHNRTRQACGVMFTIFSSGLAPIFSRSFRSFSRRLSASEKSVTGQMDACAAKVVVPTRLRCFGSMSSTFFFTSSFVYELFTRFRSFSPCFSLYFLLCYCPSSSTFSNCRLLITPAYCAVDRFCVGKEI